MNQTAPTTDHLLTFFKASADSLRLDVLQVLSAESFGVLELCRIFEIPQPAMSHHLKILSKASLVATRREGNSIFYRRSLIPSQQPQSELFKALFSAVDDKPIAQKISRRVKEVHREREQSSKIFFEKNADRLKQNQDLIAEFTHYAGCVQDLLNNENLSREATVVEIGPGESPLLQSLINKFDQVLAIDSSEEMLTKARSALGNHANRAQFINGELSELEDQQADLVIVNMVLHHIASPIQFFKTAYQKLNDQGRLFIMDLCPHSQDWARDVCGDLWLGFEPSDLAGWAQDANFELGQGAYLGLKNGFQVQLKLFHKSHIN